MVPPPQRHPMWVDGILWQVPAHVLTDSACYSIFHTHDESSLLRKAPFSPIRRIPDGPAVAPVCKGTFCEVL